MILNALNANSNFPLSGLNKPDQSSAGTNPLGETAKPAAPSVIISLSSSASRATDASLARNDPIPPVYSRPGVSSVNQSADPLSRNELSGQNVGEGVDAEKQSTASRADKDQESSTTSNKTDASNQELTEQDLQIVEELKSRDREVRAHEQAHKSIGGQYAGAISLSYQSGPDGQRYAVGGEVPIDVSPIPGDPQATIVKMTIVKAAATAPAQPSTQDIMVAAEAGRIQMEAQTELLQKNNEDLQAKTSSEASDDESESAAKEVEASTSGKSTQTQLGTFQLISSMSSEIETKVDILI